MSEPSRTERAANLFDLRRIIGGLFVVWGVLLVILGLIGMGDVENAAEHQPVRGPRDARVRASASCCGRSPGRWARNWPSQSRRAGAPGTTARAPSGRGTPGGSSARTEPPKPPPTIRAPAAPAAFSRSTVASTSGTDAS